MAITNGKKREINDLMGCDSCSKLQKLPEYLAVFFRKFPVLWSPRLGEVKVEDRTKEGNGRRSCK
jgi:hypothetical protein